MSELPPSEPFVPVPADAAANTHCSAADYDRLYAQSIADPDGFWAEQAKRLDWVTPPTKIANWSYDPVSIKWYEDGVLNLCHNAIDRHVAAGHGTRTAIIFEPDAPDGETRHDQLCGAARRRHPLGEHARRSWASGRATASPSICR